MCYNHCNLVRRHCERTILMPEFVKVFYIVWVQRSNLSGECHTEIASLCSQ